MVILATENEKKNQKTNLKTKVKFFEWYFDFVGETIHSVSLL